MFHATEMFLQWGKTKKIGQSSLDPFQVGIIQGAAEVLEWFCGVISREPLGLQE
jgi:hypothetical protein